MYFIYPPIPPIDETYEHNNTNKNIDCNYYNCKKICQSEEQWEALRQSQCIQSYVLLRRK